MNSTYEVFIYSTQVKGRWSDSEEWELVGSWDQKMEIYNAEGEMIDETELGFNEDEIDDEIDAEQVWKTEVTHYTVIEMGKAPRCSDFSVLPYGLEEKETGITHDLETIEV